MIIVTHITSVPFTCDIDHADITCNECVYKPYEDVCKNMTNALSMHLIIAYTNIVSLLKNSALDATFCPGLALAGVIIKIGRGQG